MYAPRLECVSALCMFCTFCRFCRFLHRRPTVRLAHVLVYLALVLVDLCTSITARQKKNLFTHFCNQAAFLSLSYFCRLFNALAKKNICNAKQCLANRAEKTTHFFDIQSKYGRKRELLFLVCCVSLSWTVSFLGVSQE